MCGQPGLLLVEDEPDLLDVLSEYFRIRDWHVVPCHDALTALDRLQGVSRIDVVVSDLKMAGMDGFELFRAMRGLGMNQPFLVLSGHAKEEVEAEARALGISHVISKPVELPRLMVILNQLIRSLRQPAGGRLGCD